MKMEKNNNSATKTKSKNQFDKKRAKFALFFIFFLLLYGLFFVKLVYANRCGICFAGKFFNQPCHFANNKIFVA